MTPAAGRPALPVGGLLLTLAFANFTVGMGAFVVIGVLSPIAQAFAIDKASAGSLMTIYAAVYALSSPILVSISGRLDRKLVAVAGLALFGAGAAVAWGAGSFQMLLLGRAVMALGGGIVTPVAAALGVALAGAQQQGRALSIVFGGLTLAQVLGVPAGAWLGYSLGWPVAFAVVVGLALASAAALLTLLPGGIAVPPASLATLWQVLRSGRLMMAVAFTSCFVGGLYVLYTYLAPLLEVRYAMSRDGITTTLLIFGAGAVVGNTVGGLLSDRIGPARTLAALCLAQCALLPLVTLPIWPVLALSVVIALWSVAAWSFMVPQQARLAQMSPRQVPVLFALNASALYVGASAGSALGGLTLKVYGLPNLGPAGAVLMLLAATSLWLVSRWRVANAPA